MSSPEYTVTDTPPRKFRVLVGYAKPGDARIDEDVALFNNFIDAYKIYKEYIKDMLDDGSYDVVMLEQYIYDGGYNNYHTIVVYSNENGQWTP